MSLQLYHPCPPLDDYVQMMWHWDNYTSSHPAERILPVGLTELTFNLSGHDFWIGERSVSSAHAMLVGSQSEYFVIDTSQPTTILSVLFKPGVTLDVFGLSAKELHNSIVKLSDVWFHEADALYNLLMENPDVSKRFRILENTLLRHLKLYRERHYAVEFALNAFSSASAPVLISDLQYEVALSPPRFIQVFRDEVGFTPKLFSRLQRFHQVLDTIAGAQQIQWAELALELGYYDQSHLINEFRKFAGISPSAYKPFSKEHNKNIPYLEKS